MTSTLERAEQDIPIPPRMTFEEYLEWDSGDRRAEWVDGEIVLMSPASADHQLVRDFLLVLVRFFVESHGLGVVIGAPFLMRLPNRPSGREPDLLFVVAEHAERVRQTYLDGPADLAVEIVSPESIELDRAEKFLEYESAGVREYWLLDLMRREAIFYQLGEDGHYHPGPIDADGWYHSVVLPGFRLRVEWLWRRPLPPLPEVIGQIGA